MTEAQGYPRILVVGYLCEPHRGSEAGAGWGVLRAAERFGVCTVVTGPQSGAALVRWQRGHPESTFEIEVVREPLLAPLLKRVRVGEFLVYLAWQRRAVRRLRSGGSLGRFHVAVHATISAFWLPSMATSLGIPSVWGPVGGAVATPVRLWPLLGWRGVLVEVFDAASVWFMSLLPGTRRTWRAAGGRIAQNGETVNRLPRALRDTTAVLNHALFHEVPDATATEAAARYVAWVSPMESRKGPELAVRGLAAASPDIRMIMVGDGPEFERMRKLATTLGVDGRITFTGQVAHARALEIIGGASVALFTGLREEGGLALAEAMKLGIRVVVLAHGGARVIAAASVDCDRVSLVNPGVLDETILRMGEAIDLQMAEATRQEGSQRTSLLDEDEAVRRFGMIIQSVCAQPGTEVE